MRNRAKPKYNVISVRVTDQEYEDLLHAAMDAGKTNLSDVMREGIQLWLMHNQESSVIKSQHR